MTLQVKICGLRDAAAVDAAVAGGASFVGFVFYAKSPRVVEANIAASLIARLPVSVTSVGLFVDPTDEELDRVLRIAPLRMIQLHGTESPERVLAVKKLTGLPVIKAVGIAAPQDILTARTYEPVADLLLLDAKPSAGGRPGGNAAVFDWSLLKNASFTKPWLLAGGLNVSNIEAAVAETGTCMLDVSSGVESGGGQKSPTKIRAFLAKTHKIETCC